MRSLEVKLLLEKNLSKQISAEKFGRLCNAIPPPGTGLVGFEYDIGSAHKNGSLYFQTNINRMQT